MGSHRQPGLVGIMGLAGGPRPQAKDRQWISSQLPPGRPGVDGSLCGKATAPSRSSIVPGHEFLQASPPASPRTCRAQLKTYIPSTHPSDTLDVGTGRLRRMVTRPAGRAWSVPAWNACEMALCFLLPQSGDTTRPLRPLRALRVTSAPTRCTDMRSARAETRCPRGDSSLRPRARSVSHDKAILAGARIEPRLCPVRLRVPPFANRTFDRSRLSPWDSTWECCSGIVCDRVRRRPHRAPRLPRHASTSVRVRNSSALFVAPRQRRERKQSRRPKRIRRRKSWNRRSCHGGRRVAVARMCSPAHEVNPVRLVNIPPTSRDVFQPQCLHPPTGHQVNIAVSRPPALISDRDLRDAFTTTRG